MTCVAFVLGRSLWTRRGGGWTSSHTGDWGVGLSAALNERSDVDGRLPISIVYEPQTVSHDRVDGTLLSRRRFSEALANREKYPLLADVQMGWGIDPPDRGGATADAMGFHYEVGPGLLRFAPHVDGARALDAAWTLPSVAAALGRDSGGAIALVLTDGYAGLASSGCGKHLFTSWIGPHSHDQWRAIGRALSELGYDSRTAQRPKSTPLWVFAQGEAVSSCPLWSEWEASGERACLGDLDALADVVEGLATSGAGNMMLAYPRVVDLGRPIRRWMIGCSALSIAFLAAGVWVRHTSAVRSAAWARMESQAVAHARQLEANRAAMDVLVARPDPAPPRLADVLVGLGSSLPEGWVLDTISLRDRRLEISGPLRGGGRDHTRLSALIERTGFVGPVGPSLLELDEAKQRWRATGVFGKDPR